MPEELHTLVYRVLRYTPNLVRDEWINVGILLYDPARKRLEPRLIADEPEFARLRRLHPDADLALVRALAGDFAAQRAEQQDLDDYLAGLDETLSNVLELSPRNAVLAENFDAELDRLYHDHVEPPGYAPRAAAQRADTPLGIRTRANQVFRQAGILGRLFRGVRVEEFTDPGDPFRLDYGYQRNGTRGFAHALALSRDPAQAKIFAYTAERMQEKLRDAEFAALTETEPRPDNPRHQFVARLLRDRKIELVPLVRLMDFANRLRATIN